MDNTVNITITAENYHVLKSSFELLKTNVGGDGVPYARDVLTYTVVSDVRETIFELTKHLREGDSLEVKISHVAAGAGAGAGAPQVGMD